MTNNRFSTAYTVYHHRLQRPPATVMVRYANTLNCLNLSFWFALWWFRRRGNGCLRAVCAPEMALVTHCRVHFFSSRPHTIATLVCFVCLRGVDMRSQRRGGGGLRILSCSRVFLFFYACTDYKKQASASDVLARQREECVRMVCLCVGVRARV